jgi:hypothetical protein
MAWRFVLLHYAPLLAAFSLAWELLQLPLYTLPAQAPPRDTAYALLHCSAGDVLIGTGALVAALVITRARAFQLWRWTRVGGSRSGARHGLHCPQRMAQWGALGHLDLCAGDAAPAAR